jgi:hypothetical protein
MSKPIDTVSMVLTESTETEGSAAASTSPDMLNSLDLSDMMDIDGFLENFEPKNVLDCVFRASYVHMHLVNATR